MTAFDYTMVFMTILIALALESVAKDIDVLIAARHRVKWHWMAPLTALNTILGIVGQFWYFWGARNASPLTYSYLVSLSPVASMLVMFLSASAALPSEVPPEGLDLRQWYYDNCPRYWGLVIALMVCFIVANVFVFYLHIVPQGAIVAIAQCVITIGLCASLVWTRAPWWHAIVIPLFTVTTLLTYGSLTLR